MTSLLERAVAASGPQGVMGALTPEEQQTLRYVWPAWARAEQLPPPGDWQVWAIVAGRGFGKTRSGVEWVQERVWSGQARRIALVGRTAADIRDTVMEGESGFLAMAHPDRRPLYEPSKRRVTWPNGAIATTFSGENPDELRGPQFDTALCDELAAWKYARETWDNLMLAVRIGPDPRTVIMTTPKPITILQEIMAEETTVITRGSTYANRANLAGSFLKYILATYGGTQKGRQEIEGEMLEEAEGALWKRSYFRREELPVGVTLVRVIIAVDPAGTSGDTADETGIVVAAKGSDGRGYVLADLSGRYSPDKWASLAVDALTTYSADRIVAEANFGGDMVESTIRTVETLGEDGRMIAAGRSAPVKLVHASRGKAVRAEPIAALYEQGRVSHVGQLRELEDQLCTWVPEAGKSPDRLDALVWAFTELMMGAEVRMTHLGA